jgi:hypothetical protein
MAAPNPWYQDPEMIRALLGAGGAGLETFSNYQQGKQNREQQQQLSRSATLGGLLEGDQSEDFLRERNALDAFQQNPYAQLEADQRQAIKAALLGNISNVQGSFDPSSGTGSLSGGVDLSRLTDPSVQKFFSEPSRLGARQEFDFLRASVAPNVPIGSNLPMGGSYGAFGTPEASQAASDLGSFQNQRFADLTQRRETERDAIMRALDGDIAGQKQKEEKKGGGWLKKLGKIGLIAGGAIATGLTGGAAAPLIAAAAGAGAGAIDGGWKGALLGAGTGALTGGLGGGAAAGAKMGLGQAAKSAFTNPNLLMRMGGTAMGGPVGSALNMAGQFGVGSRIPGMPTGPRPQVPPQQLQQFRPAPVNPAGGNPWGNVQFGGRR